MSEVTDSAEKLAGWVTEASMALERGVTGAGLVGLSSIPDEGESNSETYELERLLLNALRRDQPVEVRRIGERLLQTARFENLLEERISYFAHSLRVPTVSVEGLSGGAEEREGFLSALEELRRRFQERGSRGLSRTVERVREYIDHHYMEELTLERLAEEVALSESHLSRLFKKEVGETVVAYVTRRRIEVARQLLAEGSLSVKEVSGRSGFADASYFSRVFTRHEGISPSDYRRGLL